MMKKALLFAILALTINALAQSKYPTASQNENVRRWIDPTERTVSTVHSEMNLGQAIESKKPEQPSLYQEYDSIYTWGWDTIVGWKATKRDINMVYDANHNLTNFIEQGWNGSVWVNYWQNLYSYDTNNNLTKYILKNWIANSWENYAENEYFYDINNILTEEHQRNGFDTSWYMYSKNLFNYDNNNNLVYKVKQNWNDSIWVDSWHYTFAYDANNNRLNEVWQMWKDSVWTNYLQAIYSYDLNNNKTLVQQQEWNDSIWGNHFQFLFTYDQNNNETSWTWQIWNGNNWRNYSQDIYTYDANNFKLSDLMNVWNTTGSAYKKTDSTHYYFHTNVGINDLTSQGKNIIIYPNPTTGKFAINSHSNTSALEIYNLFGELIYSDFKFRQQASIDLSTQAKGIYFIKIYLGTKIYYGKVVVQ